MRHHLYVSAADVLGGWGSARIRVTDYALVHLLTPAEAAAAKRSLPHAQPPPAARAAPLSAQGLAHLRANPEDALQLHAAATDFRRFLDLWEFQPEGGAPRLLGPGLWPSQERYAEAASTHPWVYVLKARQLGATEIEAAFDGYRLRFGPQASRVHLLSLRDTEARELLEQVRFGLDAMPEWLRLPVAKETLSVVDYRGAPDDRRILRAYTSSKTTSRSSTATHVHLDEWASMLDPARVLSSVEPTVAPGGTFHILTTGQAPEDEASTYWRACVAGQGAHEPVFVGALERPDRNEDWLQKKQLSMPRSRFDREYPQSAAQALSSGGTSFFEDEDLDASGRDAAGLQPYRRGRRYVIGVDVGRNVDATVAIVLDYSEEILDVVKAVRLVNVPVPEQQLVLERLSDEYGAPVVVEMNSLGVALKENLHLPEDRVHGFTTTGRSKPVMLDRLYLRLREQLVKFPHDDIPWLIEELRGYTLPDTHVRQDGVIALGIAVQAADDPEVTRRGGRVLSVFTV